MKLWGYDSEWYLSQPGLESPRLVCGTWSDGTKDDIGDADRARKFVVWALERGDHLTAVNMAGDMVVLAARFPETIPIIFEAAERGQLHCSAIREALHDIAVDKLFIDHKTGKSFSKGDLGGRYSMAVLMDRHFNQDISAEKEGDVWRFKYGRLDGIPVSQYPVAASEYAMLDARRHWMIHQAQETHKNLHDEPAQVRAAIALKFLQVWGFRTDGAYLDHLDKEIDDLWNAARTEFAKAGIFRADGSKDTKRLQELVSLAYAGDPPKTTKGETSKDRDTLLESGDPRLEKLGAAGKNDKRKTTYIPALRAGVRVPINPQFNVLVDTGRVSSDWQQLPQKGGLREAIIARPGKVNGSLDYGGLELRTMSERAILDPDVRFSKMADYLNSGKDAHSYVGGFFLGMTYEEFLPKAKGEFKSYRDVAKIFNFGAGGGAGGFAIAYNAKVKDNIRLCLSLKRATKCGEQKTVGRIRGQEKRVCSLCVEIAKELKEKWLQAWPEQKALFAKAGRLTKGGRKVDSVTFGSCRVRGGCGYTQWLNNPFQSAGGDGMKAAMWRILRETYEDRRSPLFGSRMILNIHDELWIEFPDAPQQRHDAAFRAAKIMVDTMDSITPHVKNEVVPALMRRMFKAASDVYDSRKLLRPWWPKDWSWGPDRELMARDLAG